MTKLAVGHFFQFSKMSYWQAVCFAHPPDSPYTITLINLLIYLAYLVSSDKFHFQMFQTDVQLCLFRFDSVDKLLKTFSTVYFCFRKIIFIFT